jgi:hypothetical protein
MGTAGFATVIFMILNHLNWQNRYAIIESGRHILVFAAGISQSLAVKQGVLGKY